MYVMLLASSQRLECTDLDQRWKGAGDVPSSRVPHLKWASLNSNASQMWMCVLPFFLVLRQQHPLRKVGIAVLQQQGEEKLPGTGS